MLRKQYRLGLTAGAVIAIAACSGGDDGAADTGAAMTADTGAVAMGDTGMGAATPAAGPGAAMSDANIVYVLDNANVIDSAAGSIASTKGTSSEVRDYGKMMMRDHHTLRQQGQDLARKLALAPAAPANDDSRAQMDRTMATLNGVAKGRDFDKAYIDEAVAHHKAVLETATNAMNAAQNAELKNLIQKAAPNIQAHLDRAQAIQRTLQ